MERYFHHAKIENAWYIDYILQCDIMLSTGGLAQLVERLLCMQKVRGSIPLTSILVLVSSLGRCGSNYTFSTL